MYLEPQQLKTVLEAIAGHFSSLDVLMDSYTVFAARATRYKNPINDVGVTQVYGMDDPEELERAGVRFVAEHDLIPEQLIRELPRREQGFFRTMFAGRFAKGIYRLYSYQK